MKLVCALCVSVCAAHTHSTEACDDPVAGSSMVQQAVGDIRKMEVAQADGNRKMFTSYAARPAMEYYKHWSRGSISHQLEKLDLPTSLLSMTIMNTPRTEQQARKLIREYRDANCAGHDSQLKLHDASTDEQGVHHTVLTDPDDKMQYVAFVGKYVMHQEPPLCPTALIQDDQKPDTKQGMGGQRTSLSLDDPQVEDCTELFHRTVKDPENCGADMDVDVLAARLQIVDGIGIEMDVKISQKNQSKFHRIMCDFEVPSDHHDASLMQLYEHDDGAPGNETAPGLEAVLVLSDDVDLCDLSTKSGVTLEQENELNLMETFKFGELSRFKGYEYLSEVLPRIGDDVELNLVEKVPDASDLRSRFPKCFPKAHNVDVVRNQGQCGSCWAFAVASTVMNELCVSGLGQRTLAKANDRLEVSVSQIMACNKLKRGCNGGHAVAAHTALSKVGITRERDSPYACGGTPKNGVDKKAASCAKYPWGPTCAAGGNKEKTWNYAGATAISGEAKMKELVAAGHSLYATHDVFPNFMTLKKEVYTKKVGKQLSGHALVIVAYGKDGDTPWWLLQNSWGSSWGDNGYGKMLRGKNLCGIEDTAYYMRSWVTGGSIPPCFDGTYSGVKRLDFKTMMPKAISCKDMTNPDGFYGNSCLDKDLSPGVNASCPVTCGACLGGMGSASDWGTGKATPPAPAPPATYKAPATTKAWTPPGGWGTDVPPP